jgi:hypothetical protein
MKGGYTPKYKAVEDASNAALDREGDLLEAVLNCLPTTMAGVVAVLDHLSLPEFLIEGREGTGMTTLEGLFECESSVARRYRSRGLFGSRGRTHPAMVCPPPRRHGLSATTRCRLR